MHKQVKVYQYLLNFNMFNTLNVCGTVHFQCWNHQQQL